MVCFQMTWLTPKKPLVALIQTDLARWAGGGCLQIGKFAAFLRHLEQLAVAAEKDRNANAFGRSGCGNRDGGWVFQQMPLHQLCTQDGQRIKQSAATRYWNTREVDAEKGGQIFFKRSVLP